MATMVTVACLRCKKLFEAREADRKRGWGKYCSKSCKAVRQAKTRKPKARHDGRSPMRYKVCDTCGDPAINGVYVGDGIEWGCALHHDTTSWMDDHGQW